MQTSEILNFAEFWNFNADHAEEKDDEGTEVFIVGIISQSGVAQSTNSAGPLWSSCHGCRELKFSGRMSCGSWKISGHRFDHYGRIHFVEQRSLCDNLRAT